MSKKKYDESFNDIAFRLCATGAMDKDLALAFGTTTTTVQRWRLDHEEFGEAVWAGKDIFDGELIENSLVKRAKGYEIEVETKERMYVHPEVGEINPDDPESDRIDDIDRAVPRMVTTKIKTKHIPADVNAAKFWLKNRRKYRFTDDKRIELNGGDGVNVMPKVEVEVVHVETKSKEVTMGKPDEE